MNKCYALHVLKDEGSYWSDVIAVSNSIDKLSPFIVSKNNCQYVGSYDKINSPYIVRYTEEGLYPRYKIAEIPYVC